VKLGEIGNFELWKAWRMELEVRSQRPEIRGQLESRDQNPEWKEGIVE